MGEIREVFADVDEGDHSVQESLSLQNTVSPTATSIGILSSERKATKKRKFNKDAGYDLRFNDPLKHVSKRSETPQYCFMCEHRSRVTCSICEVHLCTGDPLRGSGHTTTCFHRFHSMKKLPE